MSTPDDPSDGHDDERPSPLSGDPNATPSDQAVDLDEDGDEVGAFAHAEIARSTTDDSVSGRIAAVLQTDPISHGGPNHPAAA